VLRSVTNIGILPERYVFLSGGGFVLSTRTLKLTGNITEISRAGLYEDHRERVTVFVEGAEPLYAELRLPNRQGWNLGQRVLIVIAPADADDSFPVA
jgi:hypothetical protein